MTDVKALLNRQATWQQHRGKLPWAMKIRMAEQIRDGLKSLMPLANEDLARGLRLAMRNRSVTRDWVDALIAANLRLPYDSGIRDDVWRYYMEKLETLKAGGPTARIA